MKEAIFMVSCALAVVWLAVRACAWVAGETAIQRPVNGFRDGQIVYVKASCHKRLVTDWNSWLGGYDTSAKEDDDRHFDKQSDLVADPKECVQW